MSLIHALCVVTLLIGANSETIKQILDSMDQPELAMLKSYLQNMKRDLYTKRFASTSGQRYTFFAPSNTAFEKLPRGQRDLYRSASINAAKDFGDLLAHHTAAHDEYFGRTTPVKMAQFTERTQRLGNMAGQAIFFTRKGPNYYANGARITRGDIQASNGIVHVVDTIMLPTISENDVIYNKLSGLRQQNTKIPQPKFTKFLELLRTYVQHPVSSPNSVSCLTNLLATTTVFAPTDDAFRNIDNIRLNQLKGNPIQLKKVVDSHVICTGIYFNNMLIDEIPNNGIGALYGTIQPNIFLNQLYVSNGCAKGKIDPVAANMTMLNGVIQPIDTVLGYMYSTLLEEIIARRDISEFRRYAQGSPRIRDKLSWEGQLTLDVPDNAKYTLFAPLDPPRNVDNGFEISQRTDLENILLSHMVQGQVTLEDMTSSRRINTLGKKDEYSQEPAQLHVQKELNDQGQEEYFVLVNNVRGKIVQSDICVRNGIIHIVDTLLAIPSQSPMAFLEQDERLSTFYRELQFMNNFINDDLKTLTIFAPTNRAFSEMRKTRVGNTIMGLNYRSAYRKMLQRHIVVGEEIIFSEATLPIDDIEAEFDTISLKRVGSKYKVLYNKNKDQVEILEADNRVTNGVIHIIDEVLFVDDMNAMEIIGGSSIVTSSSVIICLMLFVTSLLF